MQVACICSLAKFLFPILKVLQSSYILSFGLWNLLSEYFPIAKLQFVCRWRTVLLKVEGWTGLIGKLKLSPCLFLFVHIFKLKYTLYTVKFTFYKCRVLTSAHSCEPTTVMIRSTFVTPRVALCSRPAPPPAPSPWQPFLSFLFLQPRCHVDGSYSMEPFESGCSRLLSCVEVHPCCCVCLQRIGLYCREMFQNVWMYHSLFIRSPVEGH